MFVFRQKLPIQYTAEIQGHVWTGSAIIPGIGLPTKVETIRRPEFFLSDVCKVELSL